jgi:cell division protein FtsI (penicillin-binding protein 3)
MTVSYGHGIAVTPLHLACAYAALVNGGIWRPATLFKLDPEPHSRGRRVFKASTSARLRQLLRDRGRRDGRKADAPASVSAARPARRKSRRAAAIARPRWWRPLPLPSRWTSRATWSSPCSTNPMARRPPSGQRTAGWNAAPIVGRVVPRIGPLLGVVPDASRDVDISDLSPLIGNGDGE